VFNPQLGSVVSERVAAWSRIEISGGTAPILMAKLLFSRPMKTGVGLIKKNPPRLQKSVASQVGCQAPNSTDLDSPALWKDVLFISYRFKT